MDHLLSFALQMGATLIGLLIGTLTALAIDRRKEDRRRRRQAEVILRSLMQELAHNHEVLVRARPAFRRTPWGQSFHISTAAWETALSSGNLPEIIGFRLADVVAELYGSLVRVRYYLNLMTRLWLAPDDIEGYETMRAGFHRAIEEAMDEALDRYSRVKIHIAAALRGESWEATRAGSRRPPQGRPAPAWAR